MRVVIDADPGDGVPGADVDDGLALGLALRSPELQVEAVAAAPPARAGGPGAGRARGRRSR